MKRSLLTVCFLVLIVSAVFAEIVSFGSGDNTINVIASSEMETVLQYNISNFEQSKVIINGADWYQIRLPKEGITQDKGNPELPVFNRSIIINNSALMHLQVSDVQYQDFQLAVAPSKGVITRNINPATIPYTFGKVYQDKNFYPSEIAELSEPYILRDFRGITIKTVPFAYNAATKTLRVYTSYKIRVYADGYDTINTLSESRGEISRDFSPIYENHFVNWQNLRYTPVSDTFGKLLVICYDSYLTQIAPYVNWKKQKGISTELVAWSAVGTTAANLQTYIQSRYTADNTIAYVQIVGDAPQIPSLTSGGGGSDPTFALVAGSDNYPDIFIGRFSAQSAADVTAQVNKTIYYEKDLTTSASWLSQALGISDQASTLGDNSETDIIHMNSIRSDLLGYGYSAVDQVYEPSASAATVTTNVNAGRGFINYIGHGADTYWVTTGFANTNATALTNGNKTPFIMDVACVNGNFVSLTCFAEAWLRNANGGAVAMYASTINQSWSSPMRAQDECTDLIIAESKTTAGGLYYNSSCKMMDTYGNTTGSDGVNMYLTWHIFGDASLMVRSKTPIAMTVTHPASIVSGTTSVSVSTGTANTLVAITNSNTIYARGYTNSSGNVTLTLSGAPAGAVTYTITATAFNRVTYVGTIAQTVASGPYMEVTSATYADSNNNSPEYNESGRFNAAFCNSGTSSATNVTATITCSTTGITLTDATETIASLAAGASTTINNAYAFSIANNIANGTSAAFTITMISGTNTWTYNFNQIINAPALVFGSMTISDPSPGNGNGRLDPGETVTISMPLNNAGAAASLAGSGTLTSPTTGITINTGSSSFTAVSAAGSATLTYNLTVSSSMATGTSASLVFNATAGAYTATKTESAEVGAPIIITIGTGTSTQAYPIDRYYNYSGHESIYIASEIGSAGTIRTLAFYKSSGTDITSIDAVTIYMKNTTTATLATGAYSTTGYTQVYSGSFPNTATSGWMGVTLTTPFSYDGTSNLGILIVKGYQSWTSSYPNWTYSTSTSTRARQNENDDAQPSSLTASTYLPNLRLGINVAAAVLNPPQTLVSTVGNATVILSWTAPASGTPSSYKIFKNSTFLTSVTGLTYTDTAVTNGTTYSYYVTAVYTSPSTGESVASNTVTATPNIFPPQTLTATAGNATVALNWLAPSSGIPSGYKIYKNSTLLSTVTVLTYTDNAVVNGTSYSYYVTATYTSPTGESVASNTVTVTPVFVITPTYLINENIQNWAVHANYGSYTQIIAAGTVSMTQCMVTPAGTASGTGSTGFVQMQASAGVLVLPDLTSCGVAEFHLRAGSSGRTIKLQKLNGSTWDDLTIFTVGTTGTTYTYTVNSTNSTTLRLSSPSNAVYVHDIIVSGYTPAQISVSPTVNSTTLLYGDTTTEDMQISNTGGQTLNYSIQVTDPVRNGILKSINARDTNWLSLSAMSGSVEAGQSQTITLTYTSQNTTPGLHQAVIHIDSDDPNNPVKTITTDLTANLCTPMCQINPTVNGVIINWNTIPGATAYRIYRSTSLLGEFLLIDTVSQTTYTDSVIIPQAYYKVGAIFE